MILGTTVTVPVVVAGSAAATSRAGSGAFSGALGLICTAVSDDGSVDFAAGRTAGSDFGTLDGAVVTEPATCGVFAVGSLAIGSLAAGALATGSLASGSLGGRSLTNGP